MINSNDIIMPESRSDLWVDKYKPRKINDIIGNDSIKNDIIEWLKKYRDKDPNIKRAIILAGDPGTGKTTCARLITEGCGFVVHEFNASDQRSKKSLQATMLELVQSTDVLEFFKVSSSTVKKKPKRHAIVMEEIDGMASGDYGGIAELTNIVSSKKKSKQTQKWWAPIICTTNLDKISKLKKLIKHCHVFTFDNPTNEDMSSLLLRVMKSENFSLSSNSQTKLVDHAQQDYRRMLYLLETLCIPIIKRRCCAGDIVKQYDKDSIFNLETRKEFGYFNYKTNTIEKKTIAISDEDVDNIIKTFSDKYRSLAIDCAMNELFSHFEPNYPRINLDRITDISNMDYYLIPASIHENYLSWFPKTRKKKVKSIRDETDEYDIDLDEDIIDKDVFNGEPNINCNEIYEGNCICSVIDSFSFKDYMFPVHSSSTYTASIQDELGIFSIGYAIHHMKQYFMKTDSKMARLKLEYPKQFSNVVSLTSQLKVFREMKHIMPHVQGREFLVYYKYLMIDLIKNEKHDELIKILYYLEMLPEQIPILMRVRFMNEDHKETKKIWTLKIQNIVCKKFDEYCEEQFKLHQSQPISIRQETRRVVEYNGHIGRSF
jgi:DNA polymerase III delta prime subunit